MMIPNTQDKSIKFVCLWQMRMFYSKNHNIVLDGRNGWNIFYNAFSSCLCSHILCWCVSVPFFLFMLLSRKTTIKSNEIGSAFCEFYFLEFLIKMSDIFMWFLLLICLQQVNKLRVTWFWYLLLFFSGCVYLIDEVLWCWQLGNRVVSYYR